MIAAKMVMTLSELELQVFSSFEKTGWDRAADPYHHHWGDLSRQSAEPMLDAARVTKGSTALDVATGAGYIAAAAANRGAHAIGLDFSQAQVELARSLYPHIEFRQGDAENLPFDERIFDAVVVGFGINHLPHPEGVRRILPRPKTRWFFRIHGLGHGAGISLHNECTPRKWAGSQALSAPYNFSQAHR